MPNIINLTKPIQNELITSALVIENCEKIENSINNLKIPILNADPVNAEEGRIWIVDSN